MPTIDWAELDEAVNVGLSGTAPIRFDPDKGTFEQAEPGNDSRSPAHQRIARHAMCTGRRAQMLLVHALGNLAVRDRITTAENQLWQTSVLDRVHYRAARREHSAALKDAGIMIRYVEASASGLRADLWSWLERNYRDDPPNPPPWLQASIAFEKSVTAEWRAYLSSRVATLGTWLQQNAPNVFASLGPPATEQTIAAAEAAAGGPFPWALSLLYRSYDGMRLPTGQHQLALFEGRRLLSLSEARSACLQQNDLLRRGELTNSRGCVLWNERWFPFMESISGDYLCVDLGAPEPKPILEHWHDGSAAAQARFVDVDEWLAAFVTSLEADLWIANVGGLSPRSPALLEAYWERGPFSSSIVADR